MSFLNDLPTVKINLRMPQSFAFPLIALELPVHLRPPREPTRYNLDICGCISREVEEALTRWTQSRIRTRTIAPSTDTRMDSIFKSVLENTDPRDYDEGCQWVVAELLTVIKIKEDFESEIYIPTFVQRRYGVNWNQAMVFLHILDQWRLTAHGGGLRWPWNCEKGEEWLTTYEHHKEVYECVNAYILENLDCLSFI